MATTGSHKNLRRVAIVLIFIWLLTLLYLWCYRWSRKFPWSEAGILDSDISVRFKGLQNATGEMEQVHVVVASDSNTVCGMIALIHSIQKNSKHQVYFHLITSEDIAQHVRSWIEQTILQHIIYELKVFPSSWVDGKIKIRGGRTDLASPLNYARFYLPQLFPNLKRVLYIDDDCIVQGDIYELFTLNLKPDHIAAFSDDCHSGTKRATGMLNKYMDYIDFKNNKVKEMKIDPTTCAFNTGVFVTDLSLWPKYNITQQLEYWIVLNTQEEVYGNERGGGGSQPPMMLVFHNKFSKIDPMWHIRFLGWTSGTSYSSSFIKSAKLLHWNGHFKPWGRVAQHSDVWDRYFVKDPLNKFKPVRRNLA